MKMARKMTRQEANRLILENIAKTVEDWPEWRLHQILQNLGIEDRDRDQWFDESTETLKNMIVLNGPKI